MKGLSADEDIKALIKECGIYNIIEVAEVLTEFKKLQQGNKLQSDIMLKEISMLEEFSEKQEEVSRMVKIQLEEAAKLKRWRLDIWDRSSKRSKVEQQDFKTN